jgi:hypothetical protein
MRAYVWVGGCIMCNFIKIYMFLTSIQPTEPDYMSQYKLAGTMVDFTWQMGFTLPRGEIPF